MEQLQKEQTFPSGIETLIDLREKMMDDTCMKRSFIEDFSRMPFPKANGYHELKTTLFFRHIFRIEDIVAHSLIQKAMRRFSSLRLLNIRNHQLLQQE